MEIGRKTAIPKFIKNTQNILCQQSEVFISQTVTASVLREICILLARSLFKNKLEFLFWIRESLSRFCIKKGK